MLKDIKLDDLREKLNNSLIKPVEDIRIHGYFTKFEAQKLSRKTLISLINLWIKLMDDGIWKSEPTIEHPQLFIADGLQITDMGVQINHRTIQGQELANLINILAISSLENHVYTEQVLLANLCERIDHVLEYCPKGFKDIEPAWESLKDYLEDVEKIPHEIAEDRDILNRIKKYLIEKYKFVEAYDFRYSRGYTHDDVLVEFIKYSYFYELPNDHRYDPRFMAYYRNYPLYKYAGRHLDWYWSQDHLENDPKAKYINPYLSALNKMWYRFNNDGDMMTNITQPSAMIGLNALTALDDLPFKDSIIINCFVHRTYYKLSKLERHYTKSDEELEEYLNSYTPERMPKVSGMSNEDYLDIINGRKSDQWFHDFDMEEARLNVLDWSGESWLEGVMQFIIAIGDAFKVYPNILKFDHIPDFYGRYINENNRY